MPSSYQPRKTPRQRSGSLSYYITRVKTRPREFDIDQDYLLTLWTGKCAISGIPIQERTQKMKHHTLTTASLDRIDSSKGYVRGNVHFIAYGVNLAKNRFSMDEIKAFLEELRR